MPQPDPLTAAITARRAELELHERLGAATTAREQATLAAARAGHSDKDLADALGLSYHTVRALTAVVKRERRAAANTTRPDAAGEEAEA